MIKVFEGFAGYGGASFGLKRSGIDYEVVGMSEIDKFASELLAKNFPTIKNWGDITILDPKEPSKVRHVYRRIPLSTIFFCKDANGLF